VAVFTWPNQFPLFLHSVRATKKVVTIRLSIFNRFQGTDYQLWEKFDFYIPIGDYDYFYMCYKSGIIQSEFRRTEPR